MGIFNSIIFAGPVDWIVALLHQHAYLALVLLLTAEEAGIPLPLPGDFVIAYLGYQVSKGVLPYAVAFLLPLLAILVGSSILYALSSRYGQRIVLKFGKYIHVDEKKLLTVEKKFKRYGPWVIILGRHIPGFRIPITIFAGMSSVSYRTFLLSTFISVVFWIVIYLTIGKSLGAKTVSLLHAHYGYYLFLAVPIVIVLLYVLYARWYKPKRTKEKEREKQ
jgi:membrane protein DedA with SNARE-associated domain